MIVRLLKTGMGVRSRGFVLLASVFLTAFLLVFLATSTLRSTSTLRGTAARMATQQAFYAAESGLDRAIFELRRDAAWRSVPGGAFELSGVPITLDDGTVLGYYSVWTVDAGNYNGWPSVWVRSAGEDEQRDATRVVTGRIIVENPAAFMVSTMGDLTITSGADMVADILGRDVIFDQTNPLIKPRVDGVVNYLRDIINQDQAILTEAPVNLPSMTMAGVDLERYRNIAQDVGRYYSSTGVTSINLDGVDPEVPIIFAEGSVEVSGDFDHPVLVVAGKDVRIVGSVEPGLPANGTDTPQIGLLAKENVIIPRNTPRDMTIEAFIMADGDNNSGGVFIAEGGYGSKGDLNFFGSMAVRGDTNDTAVNLNAFSQRSYTYNTELRDNRNIPFLPFIANIIPGTWQEIAPNDPFP